MLDNQLQLELGPALLMPGHLPVDPRRGGDFNLKALLKVHKLNLSSFNAARSARYAVRSMITAC